MPVNLILDQASVSLRSPLSRLVLYNMTDSLLRIHFSRRASKRSFCRRPNSVYALQRYFPPCIRFIYLFLLVGLSFVFRCCFSSHLPHFFYILLYNKCQSVYFLSAFQSGDFRSSVCLVTNLSIRNTYFA